jgi:hypothetical protein
MIRKLSLAILAAAALSGCVTSGYGYRGGSGDYYYGGSSPGHYGYGAPYGNLGYGTPGGWYGGLGYGYSSYGGYYRYGSPYGYYPYAYYGPGYGYPGPYRAPYHRPHAPRVPQREGGYGSPPSAAQMAELRRQAAELSARRKGLPLPGASVPHVSTAIVAPELRQQRQPERIAPRDRMEPVNRMQQRVGPSEESERAGGSRKPGMGPRQRP